MKKILNNHRGIKTYIFAKTIESEAYDQIVKFISDAIN